MLDAITITFCFLLIFVFGMPFGAFLNEKANQDRVCSALNTSNYQACKVRKFEQVASEIKPIDTEMK